MLFVSSDEERRTIKTFNVAYTTVAVLFADMIPVLTLKLY